MTCESEIFQLVRLVGAGKGSLDCPYYWDYILWIWYAFVHFRFIVSILMQALM